MARRGALRPRLHAAPTLRITLLCSWFTADGLLPGQVIPFPHVWRQTHLYRTFLL